MKLLALYHRASMALVLLGILAYSVAEEDLTHFLLAVPVSLAAWVLRAGRDDAVLPRWALNLALVGATAAMGWSWLSTVGETIGVLCRFVMWLQLIKLFESRSPRDQAQVVTMSVMLVIGACLTSVTAELGLVLLLYVPTLIATVVLFQVFAGQHRLWSEESKRGGALSGERSPAQHGLGARADLVRTLAAATVLVVTVGAAAFVVFPRGLGDTGMGGWQPLQPEPVTGFRDHVQLGASGLLNESRRAVLEMTILSSDDPGASGRSHLLRGAVLDRYDPAHQVWFRTTEVARSDLEFQSPFTFVNQPSSERGPFYLMRIAMFDQATTTLFAKWRPIQVALESPTGRSVRVRRNHFDGALSLSNYRAPGLTYRIMSSPYADSPSGLPVPDPPVPMLEPDPPEMLRPQTFHGTPVRTLALEILLGARINLGERDWDTIERAAGAFQSWLRRECVYTTELVAPDEGQDPIEMFLFDPERGRRGHCEYFASAMTAMCQSVDIPARVVTGYVASEYSTFTDSYTVRENHAHAWVEIEVRPGRWNEFDPSPSAEISRLHAPGSGFTAGLRHIFDRFQIAWVESVVAFDRNRQASALRSARQGPLRMFERIGEALGMDEADEAATSTDERSVSLGESLRPILALIGIIAFLIIALWTVISLLHGTNLLKAFTAHVKLALIRGRSGTPDGARATLEHLYALVLLSLRRAGLEKPKWVPPLTHARALGGAHPDLAVPVSSLSSLYYEARFSGRVPTPEQVSRAEAWAREIIESCRTRTRRGRVKQPA